MARGAHSDASAGRALVRLQASDGVAIVTLARPRMRNALVPEFLLDLCVALETVGRREDIRCVLLLAEGTAFCIGCDMRRLAREIEGSGSRAYAAELVGLLNQAMLTLMRLPQPVVAGVHGAVEGGGLGLVLAADVVVAADDLRLSAGYRDAGFPQDGGWTVMLPRRADRCQAGAGLLLDRAISAGEAHERGIVTEVVPVADLQVTVRASAQRIARSPLATMRSTKRLRQAGLDEIEAALEQERMRFVETVSGAQAAQDVARFLAETPDYPDEFAD